MPLLKLNIGLNVKGVPTLGAHETTRQLMTHLKSVIAGPSVFSVATAKSGEQTLLVSVLIIPISRVSLDALIHELCDKFQQDCIALMLDDADLLLGPRTADYGGAFNPEYWIEPVAINPHVVAMRELIEAFDELDSCGLITKRTADKVEAIRAKVRRMGAL